MAGDATTQYRPISKLETQDDDAFSVRLVRDHQLNISNGVVYVFGHTIAALPCIPWWYSHDNTEDERVIAMLMATRIPEPYNKLAWAVGGDKTAESAGADEVKFRLYTSEWRYYGDGTMDTAKLSPNYSSDEIAFDTLNTDSFPSPGSVNVVRSGGLCHLVLTAQNDNVSTRGCIKSLSIWPYLS